MTGASPGMSVALACGGTGGHLFPGLAVAQELADRGARVVLFVSPKEIDQLSVHSARERFPVVTLPAVAFSAGRAWSFVANTWKGYRVARERFRQDRPAAVLAMGGFTSAAPVWAGRACGARAFLHESNVIPGRANRWLARWADQGFVGFPGAQSRWKVRRVSVTGTPVRAEVRHAERDSACRTLGLDPARPVLLITGGSQGAHGVNQLALAAVPELARRHPRLQFVHLTGKSDFPGVTEAYRRAGLPALIQPFLQRMDLALAAATVAVSRSGASSLAELAARRLPAVLIPYPQAADDHQRANAQEFVRAGAAQVLDQTVADGAALVDVLDGLLSDDARRLQMTQALATLDTPDSARDIAERIWSAMTLSVEVRDRASGVSPSTQPWPARLT